MPGTTPSVDLFAQSRSPLEASNIPSSTLLGSTTSQDSLSLPSFTSRSSADAGVTVSSALDGSFTVGRTGQVGIDYLFDGGGYEGELAIFSLSGLDLTADLSTLMSEIVRRALSNSVEGHVVIRDAIEGARFTGELGEASTNAGDYRGVQTFTMTAGDHFGVMLTPNSTIAALKTNPNPTGSDRPLFSMVGLNPLFGSQVGQIADVNGKGNTFVLEDLRVDGESDRDYNDIIFQVRGAIGSAISLDKMIDPAKDWHNLPGGQELLDYIAQTPERSIPRPMPSDYTPGDTRETAGRFSPSSDGRSYSGTITEAGGSNYHKFTLGAENQFVLELNGLTENVTIQVLDLDGNVLHSQSSTGESSLVINDLLNSGTYYVQVTADGNAVTPYELNISTQPNIPGITTGGSDDPIFLADSSAILSGSAVGTASNPTARSLIGLDRLRSDSRFAGIDGRGFATVILDTGIDLNHPFFGADNDRNGIADRIVYQYDYAYGDGDASDVDGHGSNVSSIVASSDGKYTGIAPGSNIIHLKVVRDDTGQASEATIEQALNWVIQNVEKYNIASVNMSLGAGNYNTNRSSSLTDELNKLVSMNVIPVAAAGNAFFSYQQQGVANLAAESSALAVSAVWDKNYGGYDWEDGATDYSSGVDRIVSFSQRSTTMTDIFAPGAYIVGAGPNGDLTQMGGTSQAAPHIAGLATLAQQLAVQELGRRLTFTEFSNLLKSTGATIRDGDDEDDNVANTGQEYKRVDAYGLAQGILALKNVSPWVTPINNEYQATKQLLGNSTSGYEQALKSPQNTTGIVQRYQNGTIHWTAKYGAVALWFGLQSEYVRLGGSSSWLGFPTKRETDWMGGKKTEFEGGYLFWDGQRATAYRYGEMPASGAWVTPINNEYQATRNLLGSSTSGYEQALKSPQNTTGIVRRYQNGSIHWTVKHGAVALGFALHAEYARLGGSSGWLGFPTKRETDWMGGKKTEFEGGYLFWDGQRATAYRYGQMPTSGAWVAPINSEYQATRNLLGNSTSGYNQASNSPQGTAGVVQDYQNGTIHWTARYGAVALWFALQAEYVRLGGSSGWLGFPTKREYNWNGGKRTDFEGGYLFWNGQRATAYRYGQMP